jgi:hypothetical protein
MALKLCILNTSQVLEMIYDYYNFNTKQKKKKKSINHINKTSFDTGNEHVDLGFEQLYLCLDCRFATCSLVLLG